MTTGTRNTLLGIAATISFALGLLFFGVYRAGGMTTEEERAIGYYRFDEPRQLTEFSLTDHEGRPANLRSLRGQWTVLFFGFTSCSHICPTTLKVLADALSEFKQVPQVVMVSVDPERDLPRRLGDYLTAFNPAFRGYTGAYDEVVKLAVQVNIASARVPGDTPGSYEMDHSASLVLINPEGDYAGFIKAPHQVGRIARVLGSLN